MEGSQGGVPPIATQRYEAILKGPALRRSFGLLNDDRRRLARIMAELETDPWTDGRRKFDIDPPEREYRDPRLTLRYVLAQYEHDGPWSIEVLALSGPAVDAILNMP